MQTVMRKVRWGVLLAMGLMLAGGTARANNLTVTNVTVLPNNDTTAYIKFDIKWENSWRYTNINHDAAWVFFKVQPEDQTTWTNHVMLEANQVVNPAGFTVGSGTPLDFIVPTDKVGMFLRRSVDGAGTVAATNVQVVWNFTSNGLTKNATVKIQAFAVEMVYVAQGSFKVGDGVYDQGQFVEGGGASNAFLITSEAEIPTSNQVGCLWGASQTGSKSMGGDGVISNAFPKGYNAFYCMKNEITQGLYKDFLNTLTSGQESSRYNVTTANRYTIAGTWPNHTATAPDRACNFLAWADLGALMDWAGLRPMTELEYEKACRGPLTPVAGEYAWGNTIKPTSITTERSDGTGTSTANPAAANCCYNNALQGPCRAGIFAKSGSTRQAAGASYWGIMELSGNLWERAVTLGTDNGRSFTGLHGNGVLTSGGDADVSQWPSPSTADGVGTRGGSWYHTNSIVRVSDRVNAANVNAIRTSSNGGRAVRSSPSGVDP